MLTTPVYEMSSRTAAFLARTGLHSSGSGVGSELGPWGSIILAALFGMFCGLVAGFVVSHLIRYILFLLGRNTGKGHAVVLVSALTGALVFGLAAAANEDE